MTHGVVEIAAWREIRHPRMTLASRFWGSSAASWWLLQRVVEPVCRLTVWRISPQRRARRAVR